MDKYYFEFQCLGCDTVWLMEGKKKEGEKLDKPVPKYCPSCGIKFEAIVSQDTIFAKESKLRNVL
jgi:hypothetical protein